MKPMDVTDLKTRAFVVTTREKKEEEAMSSQQLIMPKATRSKKK